MICSFSKGFIFIHVSKTAGSNMTRALEVHEHKTEHFLFNRVLARLGIHLPDIDVTPHRDYRPFYSDEMRRKVEKHLAVDIEIFGYEFDDGRPARANQNITEGPGK